MAENSDRHSQASEPEVITDPVELVHRETRNGLLQAEEVLHWIDDFAAGRPFKLRPYLILGLHRTAMDGITALAGTWRNGPVIIHGSRHTPPQAAQVPFLVEEMCEYVNDHWESATSVHLAAYVMWKMNWIHPFVDGNGRTARAVSYLVLCAKTGMRLPGTSTIPESIAANKTPYYRALEAADAGDLHPLEEYLGNLLAAQLVSVHEIATGGGESS